MPICCEPGARFPIVLDGDKGKSPEPTFWCRHLPARQFRRLTELGDRMAEVGDLGQQIELMTESLSMAVCGWQDITDFSGAQIPFDVDGIMDILTVEESAELLAKIARGQRLSGQDAKKSDSPSPSDSGSTAAAVGPGSAATAPVSPTP